jgi:Tfp pilus assembly protein PilV
VLLEVLVALVILSLVGLAYLELLRHANRLASRSDEWIQAVQHAENLMEEAKIGTVDLGSAAPRPLDGGFLRQLSLQPWAGGAGMDVVTVTVTLPDGARFELRRLARRSRSLSDARERW